MCWLYPSSDALRDLPGDVQAGWRLERRDGLHVGVELRAAGLEPLGLADLVGVHPATGERSVVGGIAGRSIAAQQALEVELSVLVCRQDAHVDAPLQAAEPEAERVADEPERLLRDALPP